MDSKQDDLRWASARKALDGGRLSVVMPVFNLGPTIAANIATVAAALDEGGIDYELVPVDDGSADDSAAEIAKAAAARPDRVHPAYVAKNAGKGNALKVGFRASTGSFVLLLDGDLDLSPRQIPVFFDSLVKNGSDIVVGSKRHPDSEVQYPWHRRLASGVYFGLVHLLVGLPITDTQTGMKLFRRQVLGDALDRMLVKTYAFDLELLSIAYGRGAKISEAPVVLHFGSKFGALRPRVVRAVLHDTFAVFYRLRLLHYYAKVEVPPPMEKPLKVSVVIACPYPSVYLDECLRALADQTYRDFEVIVLPDVDAPAPTQNYPLRYVATGKKRPAEKRNLGIRLATGDVVAFIDDDAYPDPHWLEVAVKYFTVPAIGGVGGPGVTPPNDPFLARAGGRVYENILVSGNYRYRYLGGRTREDIDDYPSCNLFVRTDLLRKIGGYRTDFWPGEDTLLCEAIVLGEHKRIVYDPWCLVYHHRRALFGPHLRQLGRYGFHRGYFVKRFPATSCKVSYFIPTLFVLFVVLGGVAMAALAAGCAGAGTWSRWVVLAYLVPLACYLLLVDVASFSFNLPLWFVTGAGIVASHLWYGVRFVCGLCARRMPCEVIAFDHPKDNVVRPQGTSGSTPSAR